MLRSGAEARHGFPGKIYGVDIQSPPSQNKGIAAEARGKIQSSTLPGQQVPVLGKNPCRLRQFVRRCGPVDSVPFLP